MTKNQKLGLLVVSCVAFLLSIVMHDTDTNYLIIAALFALL